MELKNVSIKKYMTFLKVGTDLKTIAEIEKLLSDSLGGNSTARNMDIFFLQKDLFMVQCKLAIAILSRDDKQTIFLNKRVEKMREELEKKTKKTEKADPYRSFVGWLQSVEKYLSFAIDKENDLLYLVEATKQMITHYEAQTK